MAHFTLRILLCLYCTVLSSFFTIKLYKFNMSNQLFLPSVPQTCPSSHCRTSISATFNFYSLEISSPVPGDYAAAGRRPSKTPKYYPSISRSLSTMLCLSTALSTSTGNPLPAARRTGTALQSGSIVNRYEKNHKLSPRPRTMTKDISTPSISENTPAATV